MIDEQTQTTQETVEPVADPAPDPAPDPDPDGEGSGGNREAARWRRQFREAEGTIVERDAELAASREQVAGFQRAEVERMAKGRMSAPSDLWVAGVELADLLDDDGGLDEAKVTAAVTQVLTAHPNWRPPVPDLHAGVRQSVKPPSPGIGQALKDAVRR